MALSMLASRVARLDVSGSRAVVFSAVTRNPLVALPLVLARPSAFDLALLVVVTRTLVALVVLVALVRIMPRTAVWHNKNPRLTLIRAWPGAPVRREEVCLFGLSLLGSVVRLRRGNGSVPAGLSLRRRRIPGHHVAGPL